MIFVTATAIFSPELLPVSVITDPTRAVLLAALDAAGALDDVLPACPVVTV